MRSTPAILVTVLACLSALSGCGSSGTKTVSVASTLGTSSGVTNPGGVSAGQTASTPTTTESRQSTPAQGTRTATAPAFTKETSGGEGVDQAVAVVKAHGYTPDDTASYHPNQTLQVLVATRTGSADGYAQQAFFFVDGRYLGTDTSTPSAGIKLVSQGDTEATLAYRLYRPGDPLCCARGGEATVRFALNNGRLVPLDPIPPANSSTTASRQ
ncbi:MAG TPA: LppP/LprE family lipoprotein [Solirubrobacteraceae bacterium]|nr:LppP/LprE family lipoprotein [Solirubrobacteraceae bacterium]